jgi:hypothetical protein
MDDGEAITGAIAICRDWAIGTDDKKAINFFTKNEPQVPILSTLEFIKYWVDTTGPMTGLVQNVLQNVRMKARYEPDKNHSLYDWWHMFANLS